MNEEEKRQKESFIIKLKWKIYNKDFKSINNFEYSCFKFKIKMTEQQHMEEFIEFIEEKEPLLPWDLCNFFMQRRIKYSIHFRYLKDIGYNGNWVLFKTVLFLKLQKLRVYFLNYINNFKIVPSIKKREINGKLRRDILVQFFNINKRTVYFLQMDSNIWWKPKKIVDDFDKGHSFSVGWLFMQIGKIKFK